MVYFLYKKANTQLNKGYGFYLSLEIYVKIVAKKVIDAAIKRKPASKLKTWANIVKLIHQNKSQD